MRPALFTASAVVRCACVAMVLFSASASASASLWTCQMTGKVRTVLPARTSSTVQVSLEVELLDDGTALIDNHLVPYKIPATYYLHGKTGYLYPDRDTVIQSIYDTVPGVSNVMVLSNYVVFKLNKRMDKATKQTAKSHADEEFITPNGMWVRAIADGKGTCTRLQ